MTYPRWSRTVWLVCGLLGGPPGTAGAQSVSSCVTTSALAGLQSAIYGVLGVPKASPRIAAGFLGNTVLACTANSAAGMRNRVMSGMLLSEVARYRRLLTLVNQERVIALGDVPGSEIRLGRGGLTFVGLSPVVLTRSWLRQIVTVVPTASTRAAVEDLGGASPESDARLEQWHGTDTRRLTAVAGVGIGTYTNARTTAAAAQDLSAYADQIEREMADSGLRSGRAEQYRSAMALRQLIATTQRLRAAAADLRAEATMEAGGGRQDAIQYTSHMNGAEASR